MGVIMKSYRAVIIVFTLILSGLAALPVLASQWKVDVSWERFADIYQDPVYVNPIGCLVGRPGSIFVIYGSGFLPYEELGLQVNGYVPFYQGSQNFSLQASETGSFVIRLHADSSEPSGLYMVQFVRADQQVVQTYIEVSRYSDYVCDPLYFDNYMIFEITNITNLPLIMR